MGLDGFDGSDDLDARLLEVDPPFGGPTHRRPTKMSETNPLTTGAVARLLKTTEPRVAETVRRGHITPEPIVVAGRRLWSADQLLQAAEALDLLTPELKATLSKEVARG